MRVLLVGEFLFPQGSASASRIRCFAEGFVSEGAEVTVVSTLPWCDTGESHQLPAAISHIPLARPLLVRNSRTGVPGNPNMAAKLRYGIEIYAAARRAAGFVARAGPTFDVVLLYGRGAAKLGRLAQLAQRKSFCVWDSVEPHEQFSPPGGRLNPFYWDWAAGSHLLPKLADAVSGISRCLADRAKAAGAKEAIVIPALCRDEAVGAPRFCRASKLRLLYVGSLVPRDDPAGMFQFAKRAADMGLAFELALVGRFQRKSEERWKAFVASDPVLSRVIRWHGPVSQEELDRMAGEADVFVLPRADTLAERAAFPTRLPEFLVRGKPVLVAPVGDIPLYLKDGASAIFLDPTAPEGAVRLLSDALGNPQLRERIGRCGREVALTAFGAARHCRQLLAMAGRKREAAE